MWRNTVFNIVASLAIVGGTPLAARAQLLITEVLVDPVGVNTGRQVVELTNVGVSPVEMGSSGYWIYFPPARWQFPSGVKVAPGDSILVHINKAGAHSDSEFYTGISGMRSLRVSSATGDSLGLYRSNLFSDPAEILDFLQWGASGNSGEDAAVGAGIWPAAGFIDMSQSREGSSLSFDGSGNSPSDWCIDGEPTIGAPNDACARAFARSFIRLNEVGRAPTAGGGVHPFIEFKNTGPVLDDLAGKRVSLGGGSHTYAFPIGTSFTQLGPGEIVTLHLGVSGVDKPFELYSGAGTFRDLLPTDSVTLHAVESLTDPTGILDHLQWGSAASTLEGAAVVAGAWVAGALVDASDLRARGGLASNGEGLGATRWRVDNTPTPGDENSAPPDVPVVINEILIDPPGDAPGLGEIELYNSTSEALDLRGFTICLEVPGGPATCFSIPAGTTLGAGKYLEVHWNRSGIIRVGHIYTGPALGPDPSPVGGAAALFVSPVTTDAGNLIDYVRWGQTESELEAEALAYGLWPAGGAVAVVGLRDNSSVAYLGIGDDPESFRLDITPSLGGNNDESATRKDPFRRGDCNDDAKVDLSDAIFLLGYLFLGGRGGLCKDACDANDDEVQDISDGVYVLNYLFGGGPTPTLPGPGPLCDVESAPGPLSCGSYLSCLP